MNRADVTASVLIMAALVVAMYDLKERRIPNLLNVGLVVYGFLLHWMVSGWKGLLLSCAGLGLGAVLILIPMLIPYARRGMGAGDVKLMAAVGSVVGVPAIVGVFILTALFGGVLSIVALQQREKPTKPRPRLLTLGTAANGSVKIPYGVAISFSVLTVAGLRIF